MLTHNQRVAERDKMRQLGKEIVTAKDEIVARKIDKIQRHYQGLETQLQKLRDRRTELLTEPATREETLEQAKSRLQGGKKAFIVSLLADHLTFCQESCVAPFSDLDLKMHLFDESKAWKLFFFSVTEGDLDEAFKSLPKIGISQADRDAAVKKIDDEIAAIRKEIDQDLATEKSLK
jgi:hypothetical protein